MVAKKNTATTAAKPAKGKAAAAVSDPGVRLKVQVSAPKESKEHKVLAQAGTPPPAAKEPVLTPKAEKSVPLDSECALRYKVRLAKCPTGRWGNRRLDPKTGGWI